MCRVRVVPARSPRRCGIALRRYGVCGERMRRTISPLSLSLVKSSVRSVRKRRELICSSFQEIQLSYNTYDPFLTVRDVLQYRDLPCNSHVIEHSSVLR